MKKPQETPQEIALRVQRDLQAMGPPFEVQFAFQDQIWEPSFSEAIERVARRLAEAFPDAKGFAFRLLNGPPVQGTAPPGDTLKEHVEKLEAAKCASPEK